MGEIVTEITSFAELKTWQVDNKDLDWSGSDRAVAHIVADIHNTEIFDLTGWSNTVDYAAPIILGS